MAPVKVRELVARFEPSIADCRVTAVELNVLLSTVSEKTINIVLASISSENDT
jgi:hypothetical protein